MPARRWSGGSLCRSATYHGLASRKLIPSETETATPSALARATKSSPYNVPTSASLAGREVQEPVKILLSIELAKDVTFAVGSTT